MRILIACALALGAVVLLAAQGAARRLLGHAGPLAAQHLAQLLSPGAPRRVGGLSHLRGPAMKIAVVTPSK